MASELRALLSTTTPYTHFSSTGIVVSGILPLTFCVSPAMSAKWPKRALHSNTESSPTPDLPSYTDQSVAVIGLLLHNRKELKQYMEIATRKEWVTDMLRTSKQKADWIKGEIHSLLQKSLADTSQVPDARMAYTWHEEDVVQQYGVVLEGWTPDRFVDPSDLSTSLAILCTLLEALWARDCTFRKLGPTEAAERRKKWEEEVEAGLVTAKHRAPCCDAGIPRKRARNERDEENDENVPPHPDDVPDDDGWTCPPPKKRTRVAQNTSTAPTAAKKSAAPAKKSVPSRKTMIKKAAPTKKTASMREPRDGTTTRAAIEKLKTKVVHPCRIVSHTIIDSNEEEDAAPGTTSTSAAPGATLSSALVMYMPPPTPYNIFCTLNTQRCDVAIKNVIGSGIAHSTEMSVFYSIAAVLVVTMAGMSGDMAHTLHSTAAAANTAISASLTTVLDSGDTSVRARQQ
ncbi:hypothetical protein GGX14DRAFT_408549 [Mycena pura]|uniref:Uncharacterized protein n=1 Tax=Mycena pura TaxID=153505 RepID=A0AAD6Y183_9AGAR|nr:hypothetical protein GGX14DRAFT_408549 [Mycena pura]